MEQAYCRKSCLKPLSFDKIQEGMHVVIGVGGNLNKSARAKIISKLTPGKSIACVNIDTAEKLMVPKEQIFEMEATTAEFPCWVLYLIPLIIIIHSYFTIS